MKKGRVTLLLIFVLLVIAGAAYTLNHLYEKEQAPEARFGVETPRIADIIKKSVSSGTIGPRKEIFYFTDDGDLSALRYEDWKLVFLEQRATGTLELWANPFTPLRMPLIFNLRRDPYERAYFTSNTYYDWFLDRVFLMAPAAAYVGEFLATFEEFPPSQKPGSFTIGDAKEKILSV